MCIGAMVLTSGLSMSKGTMKLAHYEYSNYLEGDVLVFAPGFVNAAPVNNMPGTLARRILLDSWFNPVLQFFPALATKGYYAYPEWQYAPITKEQMDGISSTANVAEVTPYKVMPVNLYGHTVPLRLPPIGLEAVISEGRIPRSSSSELEVVVNTYGFDIELVVGEKININIPTYELDKMGLPHEDSSTPTKLYSAVIVGKVSWPSRSISWFGPNQLPMHEQGYIHAPEVYVASEVWERLWREHSGGQPYPCLALSLSIDDMDVLYPTAAELRNALPDLSVYAVAQLARQAERHNPIDKFYQAPRYLWEPVGPAEDFSEQADFGSLIAALLYLNAGMLMASQMLSSVAARKKEIGILKALGARQHEVVGMILLEAVTLALIGATLGFSLVRLAALHRSLSNGTSLLVILSTTFREMIIVLSGTCGMALLFGVLPAWQVARLTVMEVFRNE